MIKYNQTTCSVTTTPSTCSLNEVTELLGVVRNYALCHGHLMIRTVKSRLLTAEYLNRFSACVFCSQRATIVHNFGLSFLLELIR